MALVIIYNATNGTIPISWLFAAYLLAGLQARWIRISEIFNYLRETYKINRLTPKLYNIEYFNTFLFFLIAIFSSDNPIVKVITIVSVLIHTVNLSNVPLIKLEEIDQDNYQIEFLEPNLSKLISINPIVLQFSFPNRVRSFNLVYYQFFNLGLLLFYLINLTISWMNYHLGYVDLLIAIMIVVSLFFNTRNVLLRSFVKKE